MTPELFIAETEDQIAGCFKAFKALRPHLEQPAFIEQVLRQKQQAYQIVALRVNDCIPSAAGFRLAEFLAWGKILYVDDLITLPEYRGRGYAAKLMDWLLQHAEANGCDGLHLDTGHQRHSAHKLYLGKGLKISSHHLSIEFK